MYWKRSNLNCSSNIPDKVTLKTTCIKNIELKIVKIRTGCQYKGYFNCCENLNWAAQHLRLGHMRPTRRGFDIAVLNYVKGFTVMMQEMSIDITRVMGLVEDTRKLLFLGHRPKCFWNDRGTIHRAKLIYVVSTCTRVVYSPAGFGQRLLEWLTGTPACTNSFCPNWSRLP